jgi:hypothetical protein
MSFHLKRMGQAGIAALLALTLTIPPGPAWAEKGGGKPEWAGGKSGKGGPGKGGPDKGAHGPSAKGHGTAPVAGRTDMGAMLAAGATAAAVSALLGGQAGLLSVGAAPLPPGIRKNLARGKPLPPGIARQAVPQPLLARLPAVDGHTWIRLGTELVLVGIATEIVAQVIHGVFS